MPLFSFAVNSKKGSNHSGLGAAAPFFGYRAAANAQLRAVIPGRPEGPGPGSHQHAPLEYGFRTGLAAARRRGMTSLDVGYWSGALFGGEGRLAALDLQTGRLL